MDPHAQWLRRYVAARIVTRLAVEGGVVGIVAGGLTIAAGAHPGLVPVIALVIAQLFVAVRIGGALLTNPINLRYLMAWDGGAHRLRHLDTDTDSNTNSSTDSGTGTAPPVLAQHRFTELDLDHLGSLSAPDQLGEATNSFRREIYGSKSRLIIIATDPGADAKADGATDSDPDGDADAGLDDCLTIVSRLADGRLVVTSRELVPPHGEVILNRDDAAGLSDLLVSHVEMLDRLRVQGLRTVRSDSYAAIDQLRCEWEAWDRLGPFLGPFLAVDRRSQPHLLLVRLPDELPARLNEASTPLDVQHVVRYRFRQAWNTARPGGSGAEVYVEVPQTEPRRAKPVAARKVSSTV